ncbi:hypothetical protein DMENIID0001_090280 [Sergentomyia squamirostris]
MTRMKMLWSSVVLFTVIVAKVLAEREIDCKKPPVSVDPDFCCKTPIFFEDNLVLECEKSLGLNDTMMYTDLPDDVCVSECLMNKTGININGALNKNMLQLKLLEKISNGWWTTMIPQFIDYCVDAAEEQNDLQVINSTTTVKSTCKQNSLFIIDCIYLKLFGNCPEDIWKDNHRCRHLRDYIIKCTNLD